MVYDHGVAVDSEGTCEHDDAAVCGLDGGVLRRGKVDAQVGALAHGHPLEPVGPLLAESGHGGRVLHAQEHAVPEGPGLRLRAGLPDGHGIFIPQLFVDKEEGFQRGRRHAGILPSERRGEVFDERPADRDPVRLELLFPDEVGQNRGRFVPRPVPRRDQDPAVSLARRSRHREINDMAGLSLHREGIAPEETIPHPHARDRHLFGDPVDRDAGSTGVDVVGRADQPDLRGHGVDRCLEGERPAVPEPGVILDGDRDGRRSVLQAPAARVDLDDQGFLHRAPGVCAGEQNRLLAVLADGDRDAPDPALSVRNGQSEGA